MDIDFRFKYCQLCKNRKTNIENGYYCGLTEKKPDFIDYCEFLEIDNQKLQLKRAEIQYEIKSKFKLFEWNIFANNWIMHILQKFLSNKYILKRFPNDYYFFSPAIFLFLFIISLVITYPMIYKILVSVFLLGVTILVTYINYKSLIKKSQVIAVLDENSLTLNTGEKIPWKDISIIYVHSNFFKSSTLVIKKIFDSEIIEIDLSNTIGQNLVLNIMEIFRKKTSPNRVDGPASDN